MYIKLTRNGVDSAPTAPLTDGVGSVLDWEVDFPLEFGHLQWGKRRGPRAFPCPGQGMRYPVGAISGRCHLGWYGWLRWSQSTTTVPIPCPEGAPHTSPGCNPGNPPGKTNLRSEGTPHSRGPRISTPPFPMRCSFRTHLFFRMRFPGRCPGLVCVAPLGQLAKLQTHPAGELEKCAIGVAGLESKGERTRDEPRLPSPPRWR